MAKRKTQAVCWQWTVEVGSDVFNKDLEAQRRFVVWFIGKLYRDMDAGHAVLSKVVSLHFTRIYKPVETNIGACVRLRVFTTRGDVSAVRREIDQRLEKWTPCDGKSVGCEKLNWTKMAAPYVGAAGALHFRDYLAATSRLAYSLCRRHRDGPQSVAMENAVMWSVVHFFLNQVRGRHVDVLEFEPGAFMSSCKGV